MALDDDFDLHALHGLLHGQAQPEEDQQKTSDAEPFEPMPTSRTTTSTSSTTTTMEWGTPSSVEFLFAA